MPWLSGPLLLRWFGLVPFSGNLKCSTAVWLDGWENQQRLQIVWGLLINDFRSTLKMSCALLFVLSTIDFIDHNVRCGSVVTMMIYWLFTLIAAWSVFLSIQCDAHALRYPHNYINLPCSVGTVRLLRNGCDVYSALPMTRKSTNWSCAPRVGAVFFSVSERAYGHLDGI